MTTAVQTRKPLFEKRSTALGSYWTSSASPHAVRHYLRGCATTQFKTASDHVAWWEKDKELRNYVRNLDEKSFAKVASIGGEQEQGFEQSFSSLAYAYLKDKSPRLIDFIVGFQLVDRNEDNTKAVGIFGFKVGEQWLYAPVFFLNGDLKGHELLYIKKQDAFVPMKENWVNYLISRKPHVLGEGSDQTTHQLGGLLPNLHRLSQPPGLAKYGSDTPIPIHFDSWCYDALPAFLALGTCKASALYEKRAGDLNIKAIVDKPFTAALAPFAEQFDLRNALSDFPFLKASFERAYLAYPLIKRGFDKFYGPNFFRDMAETVKQNTDSLVKRAESYITPPKNHDWKKDDEDKKKKPFSLSLFDEPKKEEKNAGLYVYALDLDVDKDAPGGISDNKPELNDEERAKLLKDTVLIKDERKIWSIAYNTQVRMDLTNPSDTGIYRVLEKPGKYDEMVVISNPQSGRGREDFCLLIRKSAPKNWKNSHRTNLWVDQVSEAPSVEDWKKYVKGLPSPDSLEKGGTYVAVHENGSGTCPFRVKESFGDGAYAVSWEDYCSYSDRRNGVSKLERPQDWESGYSSWNARIYINQRKGSGLKSINGELSIPDSYKIIKISDPPKPKKRKDDIVGMCEMVPMCDGASSEDQPIQPGNLVDVQLMLHKQASVVKLHDTGSNVVIKSPLLGTQNLSKKAAFVSLVRDHGLKEQQVRIMLKEAAAQQVFNRDMTYLVKYADPYSNLQPGPGAPAFPEPYRGTEAMGPHNSVQSIYPQEDYMPIDGMQSQMTDPSTYDPFYQPDQNAMQVAQQASQSGQKEVFDTTMIGGMLKAVRQDSLVDRYLGDLMKALDKLGRILFMFFWHQEEFEDRYGKQDLPELEDSLRNAFEVLGDVVLFLKEKTVGGGPGALNSSGVGSADAGEPNIQEAARN